MQNDKVGRFGDVFKHIVDILHVNILHVDRTFYMSPESGVENWLISTFIQKLNMFNFWTIL